MPISDDRDITDLDPDEVVGAIDAPPTPPPRKSPRRSLEWGGTLVGLVGGVGGLLAGRLGHLWPHFDVFAQFGAQFLFCTLAFVIATFMPRMKAFVGIVLTGLFCVSYGMWPQVNSNELARGPWDVAANERALRVAHFNMFYLNGDVDALEGEILRINADIITLIEFSPNKQRLANDLRFSYPYQFDCTGVPACHLAIFSKFPLRNPVARTLWGGPPMIRATLAAGVPGLTVIGVHTTRFPHSRAQLHQAQKMVVDLEALQGPIVMMGDFNATPYSRITSIISDGLMLSRLTNMPTWPSHFNIPQLAIDHIFASPDIRVLTEEQVGNPSGSDHYPITMVLAVPLR